MIPKVVQRDNFARWVSLSLAMHVLTIIIFNYSHLFRPVLHESAPYYVDIVSLPVLNPEPEPAASSSPASAPAVTAPAAPPPPAAMKLPVPAQKTAPPLPAKQAPTAAADAAAAADRAAREQEAREFADKMKRLERNAEARRQADALASLQKRVAEKRSAGAGGAPAAGVNKGSDYGVYIQSRLKDALSSTIAYNSQKPEAAAHLYIDRNGKLIRYVMVSPSPDKLFNNAVIRAIEKAKADFPPVPSGTNFDKLFVFSPQEVTK